MAVGETALLWAAAALGWLAVASWQLAMVALTAIAMGARNATVRQLKVADLTTTVLVRRLLAVSGILAGAVVGALMWKLTGVALERWRNRAAILMAGGTSRGSNWDF